MSRFPGRRIVRNGRSYDWYLAPEGHGHTALQPPYTRTCSVPVRTGEFDGTHAVYRSVPVRHGLTDVLLFHPDVDDAVLAPYRAAATLARSTGADGAAWSHDTAERLPAFRALVAAIGPAEHPHLAEVADQLEPLEPAVRRGSVAIGPDRVLTHAGHAMVLRPLGANASGGATLARLAEGILMTVTPYRERRPRAARAGARLADDLIAEGERRYGAAFADCLLGALAAHVTRRLTTPGAVPGLPSVLDRVAGALSARARVLAAR